MDYSLKCTFARRNIFSTYNPRTPRFGYVRAALSIFVLVFLLTNFVKAQTPAEKVPVGNGQLALDELRWCHAELLRIKGEATAVKKDQFWDIYDYNKTAHRYKTLCTKKLVKAEHQRTVTAEFSETVKRGFSDAGSRRFALGRLAREQKRIYVATARARLLESSIVDAHQVGELYQWNEGFKIGERVGNRVEIEWQTPSIPPVRNTGWIDIGSTKPGNGMEARADYCRTNQGKPINPRELLRGVQSQDRFMILQVHNVLQEDAYVKLLRDTNDVVASFLVNPGATRVINGLPSGTYELAFMTGVEFSRGCESFVNRRSVGRMAKPIIFDKHNHEWAVSLQIPTASSNTIDSRAFAEFENLGSSTSNGD